MPQERDTIPALIFHGHDFPAIFARPADRGKRARQDHTVSITRCQASLYVFLRHHGTKSRDDSRTLTALVAFGLNPNPPKR